MIISTPRDRGSGRPRMTRRQIRFYRIVTRGERGDRKSALTTIAGADYG